MSSIILLALIFLCIIFYSLKKRELSNNVIKNQVIFKPKERLSLGNLLYGPFKILSNKKSVVINNVSNCGYWVYKKDLMQEEGYFITTPLEELETKELLLDLEDSIENYYFFIISAKEVLNSNRVDFINPQTEKGYIKQLHIYHGTQKLLTIDNLHKILNINKYGECLYQTISENHKLSLYNWIIEDSNQLIAKDLEYNANLHYYGLNFEKIKEIQFDFFENDNLCFYFYRKECDSYYIIMEYCKINNIEIEILSNKFEDDINTINYKIKINKNNIEAIEFIYYCLNRIYTSFSNINVFSCGLYDNKQKISTCGGSAVYNIPFMDYFKGVNGQYRILNTIAQHSLSKEQKESYKNLVKNIYANLNLDLNYNNLPKEFLDGLVSEDLMYETIKKFIIQENKQNIDFTNVSLEKYLKDKYAKNYKEIKQTLIANKIIQSKWKSEQELFRLVYKHYPDAIYQYRADWLGLQSLDIFIPSLNLAIEYQGEQHYKAIELFGGEEGFQKRLQMDEKKRKLCQENKIKLIEWKYNEIISKITLDKKIFHKNCSVNSEWDKH